MAEEESMPSLSAYLSRARSTIFRKNGPSKITLVMGNPAADLDSFVSAVVVSYFYNLHSRSQTAARSGQSTARSRTYVPILNLPAVKSSELWRFRPEFGVALRLALGSSPGDVPKAEGEGKSNMGEQGKVAELEDVITIADVNADGGNPLHSLFASTDHDTEEKQELFLVDHNAPSIPGLDDDAVKSRFNVVACIDHHVDEDYVPGDAEPRIVTTDIGSCTSLVVQHLRDQGLWPVVRNKGAGGAGEGEGQQAEPKSELVGTAEEQEAISQISKLALAPILIDTRSLQATGDKCSDVDREAVRFLESQVTNPATAAPAAAASQTQRTQTWDRTAFYDAIAAAKANSLSLLTMQETFDRDYKVWIEQTVSDTSPSSEDSKHGEGRGGSTGENVNIGIASPVKPLSWLIAHAGGVKNFLDEIETFAHSPERKLGVFSILTRAEGGREVVVVAFGDEDDEDGKLGDVVRKVGEKGKSELKLERWEEDEELLKRMEGRFGKGKVGVWWMRSTSLSRKQVAPLVRDVVRSL